jgi:hypothetical protein
LQLNFSKNNKSLIIVSALFLLLTLPFFESTYAFLIRQVNFGVTSGNAWWGYYDAYLLGSDVPVRDPNYIAMIKSMATNGMSFSSVFSLAHIFSDYLIYLLPSFEGFYFLTNLSGITDFILLIFSLSILFNSYKNLKFIFNNDKWLCIRVAIIIFVFIFMILLIKLQIWALMKLVFYFSPILFIILYLRFDKMYINYNLLGYFSCILLVTFGFYKYSEFNYGIGRLDSFPSILKIESKRDHSYNFDIASIRGCNYIYINADYPLNSDYLTILLSNNKATFYTKLPIDEGNGVKSVVGYSQSKDADCGISESNHSLELKKTL